MALDYFPLTEPEVVARGWRWRLKENDEEKYLGPKVDIPNAIGDVGDDICQKILLCDVSGKLYKIIPQELKFYRTMGVPVPRRCFDQRLKDRMALRNPRKLWDRTCAKCKKAIQTSYAPGRPEIVYCESCYLSSIY